MHAFLPGARAAAGALIAATLLGTASGAQEAGEQPAVELRTPDASEMLDRLFGQLHATDSQTSAKTIEQAIWRLWARSGSPTCDALLGQAEKAIAARETGVAIRILDTAIELQPEFAEAWNRRATAYFISGQYDKSLSDIDKVLALEPRHFGALSGLGSIRREQGDKRAALDAFRRALAVHPYLESAKGAVKQLEGELEQDI